MSAVHTDCGVVGVGLALRRPFTLRLSMSFNYFSAVVPFPFAGFPPLLLPLITN